MLKIREKLNSGEIVKIIGVGRTMHYNLVQMIGISGGYDGIWFDQEHMGFSMENLEVATLAARSQGLDNFVRVAPTDYATFTRCMEAGGGGVMAAQVFTAEQTEQIVQWSKFHPRGNRGLNCGGWDAQYNTIPPTQFCEKANKESFVAIQIETAQSVEEVEQIAAVEGVDLLFVGPSDLSQSLGVTGDFFNPICIEAIDKVAAAAKNNGVHLGAVTVSPEHCDMLLEKGFNMISPTSENRVFNIGLQAVQDQFSKLFESN